jgi:hypothetical protein
MRLIFDFLWTFIHFLNHHILISFIKLLHYINNSLILFHKIKVDGFNL